MNSGKLKISLVISCFLVIIGCYAAEEFPLSAMNNIDGLMQRVAGQMDRKDLESSRNKIMANIDIIKQNLPAPIDPYIEDALNSLEANYAQYTSDDEQCVEGHSQTIPSLLWGKFLKLIRGMFELDPQEILNNLIKSDLYDDKVKRAARDTLLEIEIIDIVMRSIVVDNTKELSMRQKDRLLEILQLWDEV